MLQIRIATQADATAIWQAEVETAGVPGQLVSRPGELALESFEIKIRELASSGRFVVAEDGGTLRGHALLEPMPLEAVRHVSRLTVVVHPGHTRQSVGTALISHLQNNAGGPPKVRKIELLVRASNTSAIRLYRRLGFIEEGRLAQRVRLPDGTFVDDLAMAWFPTPEAR
jgi:ribosomal protein S18 acetylase RimI-like enzyme